MSSNSHRFVTYNILASKLCNPYSYPNYDPEVLDKDYRWELIKDKLQAEIDQKWEGLIIFVIGFIIKLDLLLLSRRFVWCMEVVFMLFLPIKTTTSWTVIMEIGRTIIWGLFHIKIEIIWLFEKMMNIYMLICYICIWGVKIGWNCYPNWGIWIGKCDRRKSQVFEGDGRWYGRWDGNYEIFYDSDTMRRWPRKEVSMSEVATNTFKDERFEILKLKIFLSHLPSSTIFPSHHTISSYHLTITSTISSTHIYHHLIGTSHFWINYFWEIFFNFFIFTQERLLRWLMRSEIMVDEMVDDEMMVDETDIFISSSTIIYHLILISQLLIIGQNRKKGSEMRW